MTDEREKSDLLAERTADGGKRMNIAKVRLAEKVLLFFGA